MRRLPVCLLWSALVISPAAAWVSPAPDVVLYCPAALEGALDQVAARYTSATHVPVHVFTGTAYRLQGLLKHRARADVVVADARAVQDWAAGGLVRADTVTRVGRNAYVLVARSDADWPHADAATLLTDHAAVLTDPTTAAEFDGAAILHAAVPQNAARSIGVADTTTVLERVRADGGAAGCGAADRGSHAADPRGCRPVGSARTTGGCHRHARTKRVRARAAEFHNRTGWPSHPAPGWLGDGILSDIPMHAADVTGQHDLPVEADEQRHSALVRVAHWSMVLAVIIMIGSGWRIYDMCRFCVRIPHTGSRWRRQIPRHHHQ